MVDQVLIQTLMHAGRPLVTLTMAALAQGPLVMLDKEYIEWLNTEHPDGMRAATPVTFRWQTGSGAFMPVEYQVDVIAKERRNPTYFREGLPLVDGL
ncbi:MAG: hypothetical protein HYS69_12525, partial [candidate division NC10 bacterium]|nr:hypothetical protein [candidate division NC10 bacterium]